MTSPLDSILGASLAAHSLRSEIEYASRSDAKVLLTGESGSGKDLAARVIHQISGRSRGPFVAINCASLPETLLEAELFGHVRGSFTDAYRDRVGLLEMADGGTIFMDEACEMSPRMQALLLRFLETGELQRIGADRFQRRVDVRVIAATNRDPEQLVAAKAFRADLYYRLNVIDMKVPPLRDRREDVPLLFDQFIREYVERHEVPRPAILREVIDALIAFDWPGNVRQLKNVAERVMVRAQEHPISLADLPVEVARRQITKVRPASPADRPVADELFDRMVRDRESFWSVVYPAFMARDLSRADLRVIITRGLEATAGSYKQLVGLLNMGPNDYRRFLNFLRKHDCHMPFARFRSAALLRPRLTEERYGTLDRPPSWLGTGAPLVDDERVAVGQRR